MSGSTVNSLRGLALILAAVALPSLVAADEPIPGCPKLELSQERRQATADYVADHYPSHAPGITLDPKMIVLHYTVSPSLKSTLAIFRPDHIGKDRPGIAAEGRLNVGSHYIVERSGRICQFMDDTVIARHVTGLNAVAIGVENVARDADELTPAQVDADARLVRRLKSKFPGIRYLIGHGESRSFIGRAGLWLERKDIRSDHTDPGPKFMAAVRAKVKDLALLGP